MLDHFNFAGDLHFFPLLLEQSLVAFNAISQALRRCLKCRNIVSVWKPYRRRLGPHVPRTVCPAIPTSAQTPIALGCSLAHLGNGTCSLMQALFSHTQISNKLPVRVIPVHCILCCQICFLAQLFCVCVCAFSRVCQLQLLACGVIAVNDLPTLRTHGFRFVVANRFFLSTAFWS